MRYIKTIKYLRKSFYLAVILCVFISCVERKKSDRADNLALQKEEHIASGFLVGAGIYDITGPAAELGMMGYAQVSQKTQGILQRIYARAFVFAKSDDPNKRLVFVSADLGQLFQSVHQGVIKELKKVFADELYNEKNVMISATHSHSGPGGYSHYLLYNLSSLGFSEQNYKIIVSGITNAIIRAHNNLKKADIFMGSAQVKNASFNRSPKAYDLNPLWERQKFDSDADQKMLLLRIEDDLGPFAMLNWHGVHGTSLDNKNFLVSGDNKGYASSMFERLYHSNYGDNDFVAAFAQEASGDISPNPLGTMGGHGAEGLEKVSVEGQKQLSAAIDIFDNKKGSKLSGDLDFKQVFLDMSKVWISPLYSNDGPEKTCPSALGISMLAGAADGPGFGAQGVTCEKLGQVFGPLANLIIFHCDPKKDFCQKEKPVVLYTGQGNPPMVPQILPVQIFRLGQLLIIGLPFEVTTMAGRRIKSQSLEELSSIGIKEVAIAGLSNAYAGYITTREEYAGQAYEGASNQFGPYTLNALLQIISDLSKHLIDKTPKTSLLSPPDLSKNQITLQTPVIFDAMPIKEAILGKTFGAIHKDVNKKYTAGEEVKVSFWGANLKNDPLINDSFLFIDKKNGNSWKTVFFDRDFETTIMWERYGLAASNITVLWRIPKGTSGTFRIRHKGFFKEITQKLRPYEGVSSAFDVVP